MNEAVYGLPKNVVTNGRLVRSVMRARSLSSRTSSGPRSSRPLPDVDLTNTDAITAPKRGAMARTTSSSEIGVRSDTSIEVTLGHRFFSSGMKVRLGAAICQPEG